MIDVVVGPKGSGKTAKLVAEITKHADEQENNIVCIEYGRRFDRQIPYQVRLIDITEYPVNSYRELLSFIAGITAKDYDITRIYIDSIYKVASESDPDKLDQFVKELSEFAEQIEVAFTITISDEVENLPDTVVKNMRQI
ncbi:MAG: hypothetical protein Q4P65_00640 [Eubacteriales bacterium]|nr:hypothetical protein [Eubacteriales bacterium]